MPCHGTADMGGHAEHMHGSLTLDWSACPPLTHLTSQDVCMTRGPWIRYRYAGPADCRVQRLLSPLPQRCHAVVSGAEWLQAGWLAATPEQLAAAVTFESWAACRGSDIKCVVAVMGVWCTACQSGLLRASPAKGVWWTHKAAARAAAGLTRGQPLSGSGH